MAASFYFSEIRLTPYSKLELTPFTVTPKVGLSYYTLINIDLGYGFYIGARGKNNFIRGFSASTGLNIPLNFQVY